MKTGKLLGNVINLSVVIVTAFAMVNAVLNYEDKLLMQYIINGLGYFALLCIWACMNVLFRAEIKQEKEALALLGKQ